MRSRPHKHNYPDFDQLDPDAPEWFCVGWYNHQDECVFISVSNERRPLVPDNIRLQAMIADGEVKLPPSRLHLNGETSAMTKDAAGFIAASLVFAFRKTGLLVNYRDHSDDASGALRAYREEPDGSGMQHLGSQPVVV
jgi:hypothetical protein